MSVPPRVYRSVSPLSASVAAMAVPMFVLDAVFSATLRVVLAPSVNTGALLVVAGVSVSFNTTASSADQLRPDLLQDLCAAPLTWAASKANVVPATSSVKVWAAVVRSVSKWSCNWAFRVRKIAVIA